MFDFQEKLELSDLKKLVSRVRDGEIDGVNVTTPFKNSIIQHLDSKKYSKHISFKIYNSKDFNFTLNNHNQCLEVASISSDDNND